MLHIFCAGVPQFWPSQHDINVAFIASTVSGGESLKGWAGMKIPALFFVRSNDPCGNPRLSVSFAATAQHRIAESCAVATAYRRAAHMLAPMTAGSIRAAKRLGIMPPFRIAKT
jgi:hypothetical protein